MLYLFSLGFSVNSTQVLQDKNRLSDATGSIRDLFTANPDPLVREKFLSNVRDLTAKEMEILLSGIKSQLSEQGLEASDNNSRPGGNFGSPPEEAKGTIDPAQESELEKIRALYRELPAVKPGWITNILHKNSGGKIQKAALMVLGSDEKLEDYRRSYAKLLSEQGGDKQKVDLLLAKPLSYTIEGLENHDGRYAFSAEDVQKIKAVCEHFASNPNSRLGWVKRTLAGVDQSKAKYYRELESFSKSKNWTVPAIQKSYMRISRGSTSSDVLTHIFRQLGAQTIQTSKASPTLQEGKLRKATSTPKNMKTQKITIGTLKGVLRSVKK